MTGQDELGGVQPGGETRENEERACARRERRGRQLVRRRQMDGGRACSKRKVNG